MSNIIKFAVLLVGALLIALIVRVVLASASHTAKPAVTSEKVLVSAASLPQGLLLRDEDLAWKAIPKTEMPANAIVAGVASAPDLKGALLRHPVAAGAVLVSDDVASAPKDRADDRRGVAGMVFAFKCAGAAAERGDSLDDVARICAKANANCRTMGVGLSPTILPAAGKPTFTLPEGEMEIGIGIHGEPGTHRGKLESADAIAERLTGQIIGDLAAPKGSRVALLVNGLGATPLEELYLLYRRSAKLIADEGLKIARSYVGEYVTSLEMAGASITVMLLDDELEALLEAPARSPFFRDGTES